MNSLKQLKLIAMAVLLIGLPLYLFSFSGLITSPLTMDEADFVDQGIKISERGVPDPEGLWHPPLYQYILGLSIKMFGLHVSSVRILGPVFLFLTLLIFFKLSKLLFEVRKHRVVWPLMAGLYLINPLLVNQSFLVDIDTSLLPFLLSLFAYVFLKYIDGDKNKLLAYSSLVFALNAWAKLTVLPFIVLSVFIYLLLCRRYKEGVLYTLLITLIGSIIFLASWWAVSFIAGLPFYYFFSLLFSRVSSSASLLSFSRIRLIIFTFLSGIYWVSPAFVILFLMAAGRRIIEFFNDSMKSRKIDFIIILSALIYVIYNIFQPTGISMKYEYPAFALSVFVISSFAYDSLSAVKLRMRLKRVISSSGKNIRRYLLILILLSGLVFSAAGYLLQIKDPAQIAEKYLSSLQVMPSVMVQAVLSIKPALYIAAVFLLASFLIILFRHKLKNMLRGCCWLFFASSAALYLLFSRDILLNLVHPDFFRLIIYLMPAGALFFAATYSRRRFSGFTAAFLLLLVISNASLLLHQSASDYNKIISWSNYGERGFEETVSFLDANGVEGSFVIARKDIVFLLKGKEDPYPQDMFQRHEELSLNPKYNLTELKFIFNSFTYLNSKNMRDALDKLHNTKPISFIVLDQYSHKATASKVLEDAFSLIRSFGDFDIYAPK